MIAITLTAACGFALGYGIAYAQDWIADVREQVLCMVEIFLPLEVRS